MPVDYNETVNLPKTDFPMRAGLPKKEPEILKRWESERLYYKLMEKTAGRPTYILHDGPPYANGDIHMGHALNKILKDLVVRSKNMAGYHSPYIPGWDTHGLPIERQAINAIKDAEKSDLLTFRRICRDFALKYVDNQREQFKRLGVMGDWDKPYLTLAPEFEASQIEVFGAMAEQGLIYKGLKPVYWCPHDVTALAEAEIEYQDDPCESIYVRFEVKGDKGALSDIEGPLYFVIWTTTTWTIPGNLAICLGPDIDYSVVSADGASYVFATALLEQAAEACGLKNYETVKTLKGSDLEFIKTAHPLYGRDSMIILGDHVTTESGTGCVHTAPGHGVDDFNVCRKYEDIGIVVPVDDYGKMTAEAGERFEGLTTDKANVEIGKALEECGALIGKAKISHTYPHCWRCKHPVLFRATEQWFASVDAIKDKAVEACRGVTWFPEWGEERIISMVRDRADWCISRQRVWGVPIPIFYCEECGKELVTPETIAAVSALFRKEGSDAWYKYEANEILPEGTRCPCGHEHFRKESDIMDVWFDSGSSHAAVLEEREEVSSPADMYLEGNDQYRGWFQSSLLTSVAVRDRAPYKTVITHGMIVDGEGKKMSKSLGNGIEPEEVISEYGADILRLWVSSLDYKVDVRLSRDILKQLSEAYRKIRNTARFILGNISDFDPDKDMSDAGSHCELDRFALARLKRVSDRVRAAYENFEFHVVYHAIHNFCVVDMSNFYLDIIKDRLYIEKAGSKTRRDAQSVIYTVLDTLTRLLAPILSYTCEEIWGYLPKREGYDETSIMFNPFLDEGTEPDVALETKWERLLVLREEVNKALELARAGKIVGASLEAKVELFCEGDELYGFASSVSELLPSLFIVSQALVSNAKAPEGAVPASIEGLKVLVSEAEGQKCARCWIRSREVGENSAHPELCGRCAAIIG